MHNARAQADPPDSCHTCEEGVVKGGGHQLPPTYVTHTHSPKPSQDVCGVLYTLAREHTGPPYVIPAPPSLPKWERLDREDGAGLDAITWGAEKKSIAYIGIPFTWLSSLVIERADSCRGAGGGGGLR